MRKHFKFVSRSILIAGILAIGTMTVPNTAQADMVVYGDFRFRLESDWDSHKKDGVTMREDRTRARIRARVGFKTQYNEWLSFGSRLRSGSNDNHVSPHITILDFDDNDTGDSHFNLDKYFVKANYQGVWTWIGRNSLPFWKHNEMFWDDDATPVGIAAGYKIGVGNSEVAFNTGYFSLPAGMQKFSGNLGLGQLVFSTKFGDSNKLTVSAGLLAFDANIDDKEATHPSLWDANGGRDYRIWIGSLQQQFKAGNYPITLGVDVMHNDQDYSADELDQVCITDMADPSQDTCNRYFTRDNRDEDDGYVISVKLGQLKAKNDWLLGYYYAHIETFAVNSSYAQDDWGRWNPQASNMKGHELRAAYQLMKNANVVARFYSIEDITDAQDGKRFRLDFNFKF
jgi:hypothetical protein